MNVVVGLSLIWSGVVLLAFVVRHEVRLWRTVCHKSSDDSRSVTEATKKGGPPSEGPPIEYGGEKLP